jgi:hypothetical protein
MGRKARLKILRQATRNRYNQEGITPQEKDDWSHIDREYFNTHSQETQYIRPPTANEARHFNRLKSLNPSDRKKRLCGVVVMSICEGTRYREPIFE